MDKLNFMKAFLILGDIASKDNETLNDKVKYKERIVFATMRSLIPQWQKPSDWDNLSNEIKLERLKKLEQLTF